MSRKKKDKGFKYPHEQLDEFSCHEALHLGSTFAAMCEEHLFTHPWVKKEKALKKEAKRLTAELWGFYQLLGEHRFKVGD